jgi:hypothetical protein
MEGGAVDESTITQKTGIVSVDCRVSSFSDQELILKLPVGIKGGILSIVNVTDENDVDRYPFTVDTVSGGIFRHLGPTSSITLSYISTFTTNKWYRLY